METLSLETTLLIFEGLEEDGFPSFKSFMGEVISRLFVSSFLFIRDLLSFSLGFSRVLIKDSFTFNFKADFSCASF